ncbi:uncharacterized protein LOC141648817 [Silene latifolia]|uniref:uncharacterized protein LOC141648817 n=1 Tax=Silene latifolia TaxID=37657 RepID=UPI003D77CB2F
MEERMKLIEDSMGMMREQNQRIEQLLQGFQNNAMNNRINEEPGNREGIHTNPRNFNFNPKIEFPQFDGKNARNWIKKCNRYFYLCKVPNNQKADLASLYVIGKAEPWVQSYMSIRANVDWNDFAMDLCIRFKEAIDSNVVEEFNKLSQTGSLEDYLDSFEHLKGLMLQRNRLLPDQYFLDSFVGGLKPAVKPFVKAFKPETLSEAVEYARLQEETISATKINKPVLDKPPQPRPNYTNFQTQYRPGQTYQKNDPKNTPAGHNYQKQNTQMTPYRPNYRNRPPLPVDVEERRRKNLCFYCDEQYTAGHVCKGKLYKIQVIPIEEYEDTEGESEEMEEECEMNIEPNITEGVVEEQPLISLNAMAGHNSFQTMRVTGKVRTHSVHILIDSGSTHNFLDEGVARKLGCRLVNTCPLEVSVANGDKIITTKMCKKFTWKLHDVEFFTDVMIVPLGGCEMVLGVQWLASLGPVSWDFDKLRIYFNFRGTKVVLRGIKKGELQWIRGDKLSQACKGGQLFALDVQYKEEEGIGEEVNSIPECIKAVLGEFTDVFAEPDSLPPHRSHDHKIHLNPGTLPINVRPYRYPIIQKNAIEQITKEMLDSGVVRHSQSPFSCPVVLVKKKDGS